MTLGSSISVNSIIQFSSDVHVRLQQLTSRTEKYVKIKQMNGKSMAYDGLGTIELAALNARFAAVEFTEMEHWRRKISKARFGATLGIDKTDLEERLTNPESGYADALAAAGKRQFDRVVVAAMFADVKTGEDFENTVTAANDGVVTVDATSGLTYAKLMEIHKNFIDNEVGNDMNTSFCLGITGGEHTDLMSELKLTSGDYSREYVVDQGTIQKAAGINLIKFAKNGAGGADGILGTAAGVRTSFCMAENAICVGMARTWEIVVENRTDLYDTKQVKITGVLGAVRTEGKLIQKVTTTVS